MDTQIGRAVLLVDLLACGCMLDLWSSVWGPSLLHRLLSAGWRSICVSEVKGCRRSRAEDRQDRGNVQA